MKGNLKRLDAMTYNAENCPKLFRTWQSRYKAEVGADLKQQIEGKVTKLEADFKTYETEMAAKKKALQPNGTPPPPAVSMPTSSTIFSMRRKKSRHSR